MRAAEMEGETDRTMLRTAIGSYPRTKKLLAGQVESSLLELRFAELSTANRAFAPMVRELRYDVSELAIGTFLQAKSAGVPIVLLPVVLAARFQQSALLCRTDGPVRRPEDLAGRCVGARSYSQTTAMWLRGILADSHGVEATDMQWLTFEDAHVAGIADPPCATRAPDGQDLMGALRTGDVDAVIVGNEVPEAPDLTTVFADPALDAERFWDRYQVVPVNHMLTMRADLAQERPDIAVELVRMFREAARPVVQDAPDGYPTARAPIERAVSLALRFAASQGLLPRPLDEDAVWAGTPPAVWDVA